MVIRFFFSGNYRVASVWGWLHEWQSEKLDSLNFSGFFVFAVVITAITWGWLHGWLSPRAGDTKNSEKKIRHHREQKLARVAAALVVWFKTMAFTLLLGLSLSPWWDWDQTQDKSQLIFPLFLLLLNIQAYRTKICPLLQNKVTSIMRFCNGFWQNFKPSLQKWFYAYDGDAIFLKIVTSPARTENQMLPWRK